MRFLTAGPVAAIAALTISLATGLGLAAPPPTIEAKAAVLVDADTGVVLFEKEMHQPRPIASTTKVMTALLALETEDLDAQVTVSPTVLQLEGSNVGLQPGEVVGLDDLLASLLLSSGNDAAVAIAEHISGSVAAFADLMNSRARELGATDTHFVNPHGLHDPNHYSSAYDLALITREALKHARFRELVGSKVVEVHLPSAPEGKVQLINHNKLLWRVGYANGVKTGFVSQSGHCLIASGAKNGWELIAVVLDSPDMYAEAKALLDYGFSAYRQRVYARAGDAVGRIRVSAGRKISIPAICEKTVACAVGPGLGDDCEFEVRLTKLKAPVTQGAVAGEARLLLGDRVLSHSRLLAGESVAKSRLIVFLIWVMRAALSLTVLVMITRTYGKAVKANRRRRRRLAPQGSRPDPGGPRPG